MTAREVLKALRYQASCCNHDARDAIEVIERLQRAVKTLKAQLKKRRNR